MIMRVIFMEFQCKKFMMIDEFSSHFGNVFSHVAAIIRQQIKQKHRVITCLRNIELSENLTAVREMSAKIVGGYCLLLT